MNDGEVRLERYVSRLNYLKREYQYMDSHIAAPLETLIHGIEYEYLDLRNSNHDVEDIQKANIVKRIE